MTIIYLLLKQLGYDYLYLLIRKIQVTTWTRLLISINEKTIIYNLIFFMISL